MTAMGHNEIVHHGSQQLSNALILPLQDPHYVLWHPVKMPDALLCAQHHCTHAGRA